MLFKITSIKDGNELIHYYNNITQEILTDDNITVGLSSDPRCKNLINDYSIRNSKTREFKSNIVKHLRIQLGLKCNFNCKYCNQYQDRENTKYIKLPDEIIINKFISKLKEKNIITNRITLWGGEPFVYFKLIKKLVPKLREIYPECIISTVSNGSLLTSEIVDWLINNKIQLTVSHDAFSYTKYRRDTDILDDKNIVDLLNRYDSEISKFNLRLSFNVVITPENCNILDIDKFFTQKMGRQVRWHFESIVKCDSNNVNVISKFDDASKKILLNHMMVAGTSSPDSPFWSIRNTVSRLLGYLVNGINPYDLPYSCDIANSDILAVDLNGNILACHGSDPKTMSIGTLDNLETTVNTKAIPWFNRKRCVNCPVLISCLSGCCIVSDEDNEIMCNNLKLYYSGIFACAWKILFGSLIKKIEPIYDNNTK